MESKTPIEERDCWRTPPWLFDFLQERFGPFDIDLACDTVNALCDRGIDQQTDSLSVDWSEHGRIGFLNPPYSRPLPWVEKAISESHSGFSTVMVLPTHCGQKWAALSVLATEKIEFEGRVQFNRPDGSLGPSPRGGTQVIYFRAHDLGATRVIWVNAREIIQRYNYRQEQLK